MDTHHDFDDETTEYFEQIGKEDKEVCKRICGEKPNKKPLYLTIMLIIGTSIFTAIHVIGIIAGGTRVKYPLPYSIFISAPLYFSVIGIVILLYAVFTFKKHFLVKSVLSLLVFFFTIPSVFICAITANVVSHTTNVGNYGSYDRYIEKYYVDDYDFLPKSIDGEMTPVRYSYYCDYSWDTVWEIYLEVKMTDERYAEEREKYADSLSKAWYAPSYLEHVISDEPDIVYSGCDYYMSYPNVKKSFLRIARIR